MNEEILIREDSTILDAIKALNNLSDSGLTLFVKNTLSQIIGTVTDGDIRRALISGVNITDELSLAIKKDFSFFTESEEDRIIKLKNLRKKGIRIIPILNKQNELVDIIDTALLKSYLPIDAVLMAGGKGERLRPLTEKIPKPLLKVGNKTIIDYNIERLISYGVKNISVTVNYLKEQIEDHFAIPINNIKVNCVREPKYLGTIGSIKFVDTFYNDVVLVMNSDLFTNINYEDFYLHFMENDADMSVAAVPYPISVPYGIFELNGRNILSIKEKPTFNYYANGGIYLIKKELLNLIPGDTFYNATDFIERLISMNKKIIRFPITGYWLDIGKFEEYNKANELLKHIL